MKLHTVLSIAVLLLCTFMDGTYLVLADAPFGTHAIYASADATPVVPGNEGKPSPQHCVAGADIPMQCFETEAESLYFASGGRIKLKPGQTSKDLTNEELFDQATGVQAVLYEHAYYGGATLSLIGSTCSGWNNLAGTWNDAVSSAKANCGVTLYEHYNMTGAGLCILAPGIGYVGDWMNDRASSWTVP